VRASGSAAEPRIVGGIWPVLHVQLHGVPSFAAVLLPLALVHALHPQAAKWVSWDGMGRMGCSCESVRQDNTLDRSLALRLGLR
jgi:hypothetical protein